MVEEKTSSSTKATEDKKKETIKVPKKFAKLVEEIEQMPTIDLAELVKILEEKFGVSAQTQIAVAAAPAVGGEAAAAGSGAAEEKSSFNVVLKAVGDKKIEVIKVVRDVTGKGLKEAKDLVDAAASGEQVIKENIKKEEAEEMKKKFSEAGATVELK